MSYTKWIGPRPEMQTWLFKKDIPEHLAGEAFRIDFGLGGFAYVARDLSGKVLLRDNRRAQTLDFFLKTPGHVIGLRDMQAAEAHA